MITITLRKLTEKSKIGFGKYKDTTVETLIGMRKKESLISIYFKLSKITFIEEILDELGITPEFRISKPGKNINKYKEFITQGCFEKPFINKKLEKMRKETISYSKSFLKSKNNGY